jgi:gliding motility-associated-like protein
MYFRRKLITLRTFSYLSRFFVFVGWMLFSKFLVAQPCSKSSSLSNFPKKAFEIVSILVDACDGSNEGQNEMIRLKTGSKSLLPSSFSVPTYKNGYVNWGTNSSNPWRGIADLNASAKGKLNYLNSTIKSKQNCGLLIGLNSNQSIPPYSQVLFITSESFSQHAQDFSDLNDTLYVIFQKSGNTAGHFVNYGTSSTRTFILRNSNDADTVVYDRNDLVNLKGNKGSDDGAVANFEFNGQVSYANYGCRIPIPVWVVDAGIVVQTYCDQKWIQLKGRVSGTNCYRWTAIPMNSGYFSDSHDLNARFYPKRGFGGTVKFYLTAYSNCGGIKDSVEVEFKTKSQIQVSIDSSNKPSFCFKFIGYQSEKFRTLLSSKNGGIKLMDTLLQTPNWCLNLKDTGLLEICFQVETSLSGCSDTICYQLFNPGIKEPNTTNSLTLSNVFTPGKKDGINDEFFVGVGNYLIYRLEIFDRWGTKVFVSDDAKTGWNGHVQNVGEMCPQGTYFYLLQVQLLNDSLKSYHGSVLLLE